MVAEGRRHTRTHDHHGVIEVCLLIRQVILTVDLLVADLAVAYGLRRQFVLNSAHELRVVDIVVLRRGLGGDATVRRVFHLLLN